MAVDLSPIGPGAFMCGTEAVAYGTQPATFAPNTQALNTINSPNPIEADEQFFEIVPHATDYRSAKDIPTFAVQPVTTTFALQGGAAAATAPRWQPLLLACGVKETVGASIVYTMGTRAQDALRAATVAHEVPGLSNNYVEEGNGCYGSMVITGTAREGLLGTFTGMALFQPPQVGNFKTVYGGGTVDWDPGTFSANKFILTGADRVKINNGGTDYFPVVVGIRFDLGTQYGFVTDVNAGATFGVYGVRIFRKQPTLTLTIKTDVDNAANVDFIDMYADSRAGTAWTVNWKYTDLAGRTLAFAFAASVQPRQKRKGTDENHRTLEINCKLFGATPYTITHA